MDVSVPTPANEGLLAEWPDRVLVVDFSRQHDRQLKAGLVNGFDHQCLLRWFTPEEDVAGLAEHVGEMSKDTCDLAVLIHADATETGRQFILQANATPTKVPLILLNSASAVPDALLPPCIVEQIGRDELMVALLQRISRHVRQRIDAEAQREANQILTDDLARAKRELEATSPGPRQSE